MMQAFLLQTLLIPKIIIDAGFQIRYIHEGRRAAIFHAASSQFTMDM